ncbi:MAG: right-handed parallel beta-helix repeat-containing protein [Desulfobacterales bacterium]|nr:right-handed parallel beta-helix repeat-containing protein [Desulfobacterales bacterium]
MKNIALWVIAITLAGMLISGFILTLRGTESNKAETEVANTGTEVDKTETKAANTGIEVAKTATLVIAASNSLSKSGADYVCDGVDDQEEINAAIDALPSGGKVLLLEGTYSLSSYLRIKKNDITLEGMGPASILKIADGAVSNPLIIGEGTTEYSDITVRDLAFDGNRENATGTGYSILYYKVRRLTIEDCYFHDTRGVGISFASIGADYQSHDVKILNNTFKNIGLADHSKNGNAIRFGNVLGGIISGNNIDGVEGSMSWGAIDIADESKYVSVIGNHIRNTYPAGIQVETDAEYVTITGNTIYVAHRAGIVVTKCAQSFARYITITSNIIEHCDGPGIILQDDSVKHCTIANNIISDNGQNAEGLMSAAGIHLEACEYVSVIGNQVFDTNVASGWTQNPQILVSHAKHIVIADNVCFGGSVSLKFVYDIADIIAENNLLENYQDFPIQFVSGASPLEVTYDDRK